MVAVKKKKKISVLTLIGKRWFNKKKGSTYHSCEIIVDGKHVHKIEYAYGYDAAWEWNAMTWLDQNGYTPDRKHSENGYGESAYTYCDRKGIMLIANVIDVQRKMDL